MSIPVHENYYNVLSLDDDEQIEIEQKTKFDQFLSELVKEPIVFNTIFVDELPHSLLSPPTPLPSAN